MANSNIIQHGTRGRYGKGCRCQPCVDAHMTWSREYRAKKMLATGVHGKIAMYNAGCRCELCVKGYELGEARKAYRRGDRSEVAKAVNREYSRFKASLVDYNADDFPHGTRLGARRGCKCEPCLDAKRDHEREYVKDRMKQNEGFAKKRRLSNRTSTNKRRAIMYGTRVGSDLELIKRIYEACPEGYAVDHIVPLAKGGAHTSDNLQYLPTLVNTRKRCTLDYDCSDDVIRWQDILESSTTISKESSPQVGAKCLATRAAG